MQRLLNDSLQLSLVLIATVSEDSSVVNRAARDI